MAEITFSEDVVWYQVTRDQIMDNVTSEINILSLVAIDMYPLVDAIQKDTLPDGSFIENDVLYICDTDVEQEIEVDGEVYTFEEYAFDFEFSVTDIAGYIDDNPDYLVYRRVGDFSINWRNVSIEKVVKEALDYYDFSEIVDAARDLHII